MNQQSLFRIGVTVWLIADPRNQTNLFSVTSGELVDRFSVFSKQDPTNASL